MRLSVAPRARAASTYSLLSCGKNLRAHEAGVSDPASERERKYKVEDPRPAEGDKGNGDQDARERHEGVHQHDVDEAVDGASVVSGDGADDQADAERGGDDASTHEHGDARAVDHARENVAAELIRTEELIP